MTLTVTTLIVVATLGLAALLSSPIAEKHPAFETAMFVMIYAFLVSLVIWAVLSVLGMFLGVL
jgi:hypothetical protein